MTIGFFGKSPSRRENKDLIDGLEISDALLSEVDQPLLLYLTCIVF
jgi:hypothetical protein